ncbi:MAG: FimV family protein, partial [Burkholderiales bacterium]
MRNIALKRWVSAMLLLLMPWVAGAAGLGRLVILSPLGQPLNAEIDLVAVEKEELATLAVRLASAEAYKQANLQYSPVLSGVRLGIEKRPNGEPYIKIVSARPVNEAFIDLLVELSWATGRIVREYTALIDPPGFAPEPAAPAAAVAVPETRPAPALPPAAATPVAPARKTAVAAAPRAKDYGPIQRGETLSAIARSVKPEGITLEQMLVSLYRSNPDAFINDNMNLVKSGKILRVPANDEVMAVTPQQAVKEVRLHAADWNAYRRKLAAAALAARESSTAAAGKITVRAEDKSAAKEAKDVVRLSKGEPPASGGAAAGEMAGRLRTLEEEAVAREKALREANERIARLEKTIQDMQRLLEIKSAGMAAAQQKAESAASAPEAPSAVKPEAGARPEPAPATATAALEAKKEEAPAAAAPADKPAAPEKAEQPQPKPKAVPPPLPPEPGFIDTLLDEPLYLAAAGGVIVLGGLALWMARRRRAAPAAAAAREPVEPSSPPPARDVAGSPELAAAAAVAAAAAP